VNRKSIRVFILMLFKYLVRYFMYICLNFYFKVRILHGVWWFSWYLIMYCLYCLSFSHCIYCVPQSMLLTCWLLFLSSVRYVECFVAVVSSSRKLALR